MVHTYYEQLKIVLFPVREAGGEQALYNWTKPPAVATEELTEQPCPSFICIGVLDFTQSEISRFPGHELRVDYFKWTLQNTTP